MKKEKKEVKVWKVLRMGRNSASTSSKKFMLHYPVGKFVKPKVGKIFCFKRKKDAVKFADNWLLRSIHKSVAINPKPIDNVCFLISFASISDVKKFWTKNDQRYVTPAPKGSYVCDELKCLE